MHIFDSHAHFDDPRFDEDRAELLERIHKEGVDYIVSIGCDEAGCRNSVALAEQYDYVYATVGWHPEFAGSWTPEAEQLVRELAKREHIQMEDSELCALANRWELRHGGVSGRTAKQFVDYLAGKNTEEKI